MNNTVICPKCGFASYLENYFMSNTSFRCGTQYLWSVEPDWSGKFKTLPACDFFNGEEAIPGNHNW